LGNSEREQAQIKTMFRIDQFNAKTQQQIRAALAADLRPASPAQPEPHHEREVERTHPPQAGRPCRVVVCLIALRRRPLDPDNNAASFKAIQDAIAETLRLDDGDKRFTWQYQQMHTFGREGVIVRIETL
jgi:hypothetical protein